MILIYLAIICNIRRRFISVNNETRKTFTIKTEHNRSTLGSAKYERSMLIQAALTSGGLTIGILIISLLSTVVIKVFGQDGLIVMNIFNLFYIIFYRCTLPTAFFLTNQHARNYICLHLRTDVVKPILILPKQVTR
ncbi:unnamed protein product [Brugia pahangi]|uniref:G_PROTEIN_RECEP_F1_2 domain-containing protein n=1 Tax=Brugia pahangi TaxID=6280 RepID=A0A0N4TU92_BRUPA|nr:unnamed protein product [Brugia pahangi]